MPLAMMPMLLSSSRSESASTSMDLFGILAMPTRMKEAEPVRGKPEKVPGESSSRPTSDTVRFEMS